MQKIKSIRSIKSIFDKIKLTFARLAHYAHGGQRLNIEPEAAETQSEALAPAYPEKNIIPFCGENFACAAEYAMRLCGDEGEISGIGIAAKHPDAVGDIDEIMDLACERFRFVTLYAEDANVANEIADRLYDKYGAVIAVRDISDRETCRFPLVADLDEHNIVTGE